MKAISALAFIPFGSYRRTNLYLQKKIKAYSSQVVQLPDMGLCMHVDILMNFMRVKFQMGT